MKLKTRQEVIWACYISVKRRGRKIKRKQDNDRKTRIVDEKRRNM